MSDDDGRDTQPRNVAGMTRLSINVPTLWWTDEVGPWIARAGTTHTSFVKRAIKVLIFLLRAQQRDAEVIVREKDGRELVVVILDE
jgi:hypothetical protein